MYPDFEYLLESLTGSDMPGWLSLFKTFGFLVAMAFLASTYFLMKELQRKEKLGQLQPTISKAIIGNPASQSELFWSAFTGFLLGFKLGGLFSNFESVQSDPMQYIMSFQGNWLIGLMGAALLGYIKYAEKKKEQLPAPKEIFIRTYPSQRISEIILIAAVGGLAGAKIFNAFETWDSFIQDPLGSLFSSSGLTFYGGLIVATALLYRFAKKYKIPFAQLCDAAAPSLILGYGLGRLGCHFSGDGDWGIFNSAYISTTNGDLFRAVGGDFQNALKGSSEYFIRNFGSLANVPHLSITAPSWLPDWTVAMNYAHNVNNEGMSMTNCMGHYCSVLPVAVFPTPLYEFLTCVIIFLILWFLRKKLNTPWHLFGVYLIFTGIERFLVETIRVNYKYDLGFIQPTQAEIISVIMILAGAAILFFIKKRKSQMPNANHTAD